MPEWTNPVKRLKRSIAKFEAIEREHHALNLLGKYFQTDVQTSVETEIRFKIVEAQRHQKTTMMTDCESLVKEYDSF